MKKNESLKIGDVVRICEMANVPVRYLGHRGTIKGIKHQRGPIPAQVHLLMSDRKNLLPVRKSEVAKMS
jgi:hypothetical protein